MRIPIAAGAAAALLGVLIVMPAREVNAAAGQTAQAGGEVSTPRRHVRPRIRVYRAPQPAAWPFPRPGTYSYPGPGYVRRCTDWYATEYRLSGTVITPQQSCWWVRG